MMKSGMGLGGLALLLFLTVLLTCKVSSAADEDRFKGGSYDGYHQVTTNAVLMTATVTGGTVIWIR